MILFFHLLPFLSSSAFYRRYTKWYGRDGKAIEALLKDALVNCDKWKQQIVDWQKPVLDDLMVIFLFLIFFSFFNFFFFSCLCGINMLYLMNSTISPKEGQCGLMEKWMTRRYFFLFLFLSFSFSFFFFFLSFFPSLTSFFQPLADKGKKEEKEDDGLGEGWVRETQEVTQEYDPLHFVTVSAGVSLQNKAKCLKNSSLYQEAKK